VAINVRATGPKGKTSDWSNYFTIQVNPALPTPTDAKAESLTTGFAVTWKGATSNGGAYAHYHVYRGTGVETPTLLDSVNDPLYLDTTADFGTSYQYFIESFEGALQHSDTARTQAVLREDTFAPSVPAGLTAEPGASSIELSWERNTDPRFQGYNVFRSVDGGEFRKVASLIVAPAYSDHAVESGKRYRYQVSAVGTNGLESARSAPYEIAAQ
jgi:fibronectin type 3 domain-containing protein